MKRRDFLQATGTLGGLALGGGWLLFRDRDGSADGSALRRIPEKSPPNTPSESPASSRGYGPLLSADEHGLQLPEGFSSRVVATSGEPVPGTEFVWHYNPDGGATFPTASGGWIYVSNDESEDGRGGVGAIEFTADGEITAGRRILDGTSRNCAGGSTPWGTWLSCEETAAGIVWECDPTGAMDGIARPALGSFVHEAAAVDNSNQVVYLTEDQPDGGLYRFVPESYPDLSAGSLQILVDDDGVVSWADVPDPASVEPATKDQVPGTHRFERGEGAFFHDGILYFATTGDHRVWTLDPAAMRLDVVYDGGAAVADELTWPDNVVVSEWAGEVFVAEDGGNMEICVLVDDGAVPFVRVIGADDSEMTGPAFSPDGTRLYFSSQTNPGRTYEVTGPYRGSRGQP